MKYKVKKTDLVRAVDRLAQINSAHFLELEIVPDPDLPNQSILRLDTTGATIIGEKVLLLNGKQDVTSSKYDEIHD